ncbi:LADA_0B10836g1_1 [Lachancea dasiensis]|uniref:LADA_0B10836g1_1 n=1 Tax=Lachancea dasiensis TaxID=1072105 RepID=A0A1G4IVL4_9SACH|nr:LADA_0B10836g1_1 [Lachancea dasiensis]
MNNRSPTKLRRALSGKSVNRRSNPVSPKKLDKLLVVRSGPESPLRKPLLQNNCDGKFEFFEQTAADQKTVDRQYQKLRKNKCQKFPDIENTSHNKTTPDVNLSGQDSRLPLADLNVEEHAGTWEYCMSSSSPSRTTSDSPLRSTNYRDVDSSSLNSVQKLIYEK